MSITVQTCRACGHRHYPGLLLCASCAGAEFTAEEVAEGTVVAATRLHYQVGSAGDAPVLLGVLRIGEDGPQVVARLDRDATPGDRLALFHEGGMLRAR